MEQRRPSDEEWNDEKTDEIPALALLETERPTAPPDEVIHDTDRCGPPLTSRPPPAPYDQRAGAHKYRPLDGEGFG